MVIFTPFQRLVFCLLKQGLRERARVQHLPKSALRVAVTIIFFAPASEMYPGRPELDFKGFPFAIQAARLFPNYFHILYKMRVNYNVNQKKLLERKSLK